MAVTPTVPGRRAGAALCAHPDPGAWLSCKGPAWPGRDRHADLRVLPGPRTVPGLRALRSRHLGRDRDRHLGRRHTTGTRPAVAAEGGGGMTSAARLRSWLGLIPEQKAES